MGLWAVTMVRDELDVLPHTLGHLLAEGVDQLIVMDNRSTDGTWEWLNDHVSELPLRVRRDDEVAYYQSRKMTQLYREASAGGAGWVIPFDADEIWYRPEGNLGEVFASAQDDVDAFKVGIYNYHPTSKDPADEPNPFRRLTYRETQLSSMTKSAVRAGIESLVIEQGNHKAHADRALRIVRPDLLIGHFPWRSFEQYERKIRNGSEAYDAITDYQEVPLNQGENWRIPGRLLQAGGPAVLRKYYDAEHFDPPIELEQVPVPIRG